MKGIPDLWEKWTHGNRAIADGDIDRDDDGLTDLEEFQNQTDPRTADTDGDGFSDSFEVANGMNPVVSEDFTPIEPDTNNNGLPDIWDQAGYGSYFNDADHDGFDDYYETYYLPTASDSNFDAFVDIYTSRSVLLYWDNGSLEGSGSIVIPPTTGTSVKIRLPFGSDTAINLLPVPYGTDPPPGELWKSRMRLSFAPRPGQSLVVNALVSTDGMIAHKVVNLESVVMRFATTSLSGFQTLALTEGGTGNNNPSITISYRQLGIKPVDAAWHFVDELIGPFSITNLAGVLPQNVSWSADYGSVSSSSGGTTAFLTVTQVPPPFDFDTITLTTVSELDEATFVTNRLAIPKCTPTAFGLVDATENFSPHLGETASFTLDLTGCPHAWQEGWLEAEAMRETTAGWQHVGWLDASQAQPGHQKRRYCLAGPQTIMWNGIATEGAALTDSPDVFTDSVSPFHRALPQVISGEPVPPPYYTIFFRYRGEDSDTSEIIDEASTKIFVPQVVKVEMTDAAYNEFKTPIIYPDTYWPQHIGKPDVNNGVSVELYSGSSMTKCEIVSNIALKAQSSVPISANIRFSMFGNSTGVKTVTIKHRDNETNIRRLCWGTTPHEYCSWRNEKPHGKCDVYVDRIRFDPCNDKLLVEAGGMPPYLYDPTLFPYTPEDLLTALANVSVHEFGHTAGLVQPILYGLSDFHNWAPLNWAGSPVQTENNWFMNPGEPAIFRFDKVPGKPRLWFWLNAKYLNFILPKP